jgi:hypothetical protein
VFSVNASYEAGASDAGTGDGGAPRVSQFRDERAYVSKHTLVARFPKLIVPLANVYFEVEDAVVTGIPVRDAQTGLWSVTEGAFSARARLATLLVIVPEAAFATSQVALCPGDPNFGLVKRMICAGADVLFEGAAGPEVECDGVAAGLSFESAPAELGAATELPPKPALCPELSPDAVECSTAP